MAIGFFIDALFTGIGVAGWTDSFSLSFGWFWLKDAVRGWGNVDEDGIVVLVEEVVGTAGEVVVRS